MMVDKIFKIKIPTILTGAKSILSIIYAPYESTHRIYGTWYLSLEAPETSPADAKVPRKYYNEASAIKHAKLSQVHLFALMIFLPGQPREESQAPAKVGGGRVQLV